MKTTTFIGKIVQGKGLGRTVGLPTLNLQWEQLEPETQPAFGVYISKVLLDQQEYYGVTNFGLRPSVDSEKRITLETFLLDYNGDGLGLEATVELLHYLRPTQKLSSLEEVKKQVDADILVARAWLGKI